MASTCSNNFNQAGMAAMRYQRYQESLAENPNFLFPPLIVGLYGAASFLYRTFPGSSNSSDLATISSFFGAQPDGNGGFIHVSESFPPNWYTILTPFTLAEAVDEIVTLYLAHPALLGGNVGMGNFIPLTMTGSGTLPVTNGVFNATPQNVLCLLYQVLTNQTPDSAALPGTILEDIVNFIARKLGALSSFQNMGCPFLIR